MKAKIIALAISSLFFMGAAHAEDAPATLTVTATITQPVKECEVTLSKSSIELTGEANKLIAQGDKSTSIIPFSVYVNGVDNNIFCGKRLMDGRIAVRFVGTYDNADGNTLANKATGEEAASGIGIGLFTMQNEPVDITQPYQVPAGSNQPTLFFGMQLVKLTGQEPKEGTISSDMTVQVERL